MILALSPFAALALCAAPWLLLASRRIGTMLAGLAVLCAVPLLVMLVLLVTAPTGLDPLISLLAVGGALGVVGLVLVLRERSSLRPPSRLTLARWLPATIGAVAWLGALGIAHLLPRADALSWAMNGDTANNLHLARGILADNGLTLPANYAVPLPNALLAIAMTPGRSAEQSLEHDLVAFGAFWALAIAATAVLLGLTVSSLLKRGALPIAIASAGGSLLAATWFIAGLPIESGYLNVHVALPFALASWLAFLQSRRHGVASTVVILAAGLVLLTVWTPLIVITVGLLAASAVRGQWRSVPLRLALPAAAVAIAAALWFAVVAGPALSASSSAFTTPGHGYPATGLLLLLCAAVAIAGAFALRETELPVVRGAVYLTLAAAAGLTAMLILAGGSSGALNAYYVSKLSWLFTVVLLAIAFSTVIRFAADRLRGTRSVNVGVAVVAASVVALCTLGPAPARDNFRIDQPLDRMLSSKVWNNGDQSVAIILANTGDHVILWNSSSPDEAMINFWLLEFGGGSIGGDSMVRSFSVEGYREFRDRGTYTPPPIETLCQVLDGLDSQTTVLTADPGLEGELEDACPDTPVTIRQE